MGAMRLLKSGSDKRIDHTPVQKGGSKVTLVLIPSDTGVSRKVTLSRFTIWIIGFLFCCLIGALVALSLRHMQLRSIEQQYSRLQIEHKSIRAEATALYNQLQSVQSNLSQVDTFSSQVREATKINDDMKPSLEETKKSKSRVKKKKIIDSSSFLDRLRPPPASLATGLRFSASAIDGIGPVSKEDFRQIMAGNTNPTATDEAQELLAAASANRNYLVAARVKDDSLEFEQVFEELMAVQNQSSDQIQELATLLSDVNQYRTRLSKTPTIAPVEGRLTSHYGFRNSPVTGRRRMHRGLDIAAPLGSPIRSAAAGIVRKVSHAPDYGKYVEISHGHDIVTLYAHAKKILVKKGEQVKKGQKIALVGMTGRTTGPHLHYEVKVRGKRVNPYSYISNY